jgi:protein gp37
VGENTNISWTHHTFNPWWGCWKISDECTHCYAAAFDHRLGGEHWGRTEPRKFFGDAHWRGPLKWNADAMKVGERRRVFAGSMCDWAERHPVPEIAARMDEARARLWRLINDTPWLDWLLLTKRAENLAGMLPWMVAPAHGRTLGIDEAALVEHGKPWPNVWLGVTAGVRSSLDRVAILRRTPARVRFISCEPLLEHIKDHDWDRALEPRLDYSDGGIIADPQIDWLIVGDESGHGARPAEPSWVRTARDAAARHGVAFHFKQWAGKDAPGIAGARVKGKRHLPILDDQIHDAFPEVTRG